jgi:hypothetical protein
MRQAHKGVGVRAGLSGSPFLVMAALVAVLLPRVVAGAPVVYFSTEESFTPTAGPYAGHTISEGDLLSSTGQVVATNAQLLKRFSPMPPTPPVGLDGVYVRPSGEILFSTEEGFFDERLGVQVKHGDLLSNKGLVLKTNASLLRNFRPMPIVAPDYGLDSVDERSTTGALFSVETSFFDERLGKTVGHGDLLSEMGAVVKTNAQLLAGFHPMPTIGADYGLDAVHVLTSGQIWFSIEETFWDEFRGAWIRHGDLLSAGPQGTIVKRNADLLAAFFGGAGNVPRDFGLDAVCIAPKPGDLDGNDVVDEADAAALVAHWDTSVTSWSDGDLNGDGLVNAADAAIMAANWGGQLAEGESVPEPGSAALMIAGAALWSIVRRRLARTN